MKKRPRLTRKSLAIGTVVVIIIFVLYSHLNPDIITSKTNETEWNINGEEEIVSISYWNHMPLTYKIDNECGREEERIKRAMNEVTSKSGEVISYLETDDTPDIHINCEQFTYNPTGDWIWAEKKLNSTRFTEEKEIQIEIVIYSNSGIKRFEEVCGGYPSIEIGELLLALGHPRPVGIGFESCQIDKSSLIWINETYKE